MDSSQLVTVIIPCYKQAHLLEGAIKSVLNQTYKQIEIIVVDDGSPDNVKAVCKKYINRLRYVYRANGGLSSARNTGLKEARGNFVKFLDSDDLLYPKQIELQVADLELRNADMSITDYDFYYKNNSIKELKVNLLNLEPLGEFIKNNLIPVHSALIRKKMVDLVGGFDESLTACEDYDLWLRVLLVGCRVIKTDYTGCVYRIIPKSLSSDEENLFQQKIKVFEKFNWLVLNRIETFSESIQHSLLFANTQLIQSALLHKVNVKKILPKTILVSKTLFNMKKRGLKLLVFNFLGVINFCRLRSFKCFIFNKKDLYRMRNQISWRLQPNGIINK